MCVGKQLAMLEMRSIVSRIALSFDMKLAQNFDPAEYEDNLKDRFTLNCPKLMVELMPRHRQK